MMNDGEFLALLRTLTEEERLIIYELLKDLQEHPEYIPSSQETTDEKA